MPVKQKMGYPKITPFKERKQPYQDTRETSYGIPNNTTLSWLVSSQFFALRLEFVTWIVIHARRSTAVPSLTRSLLVSPALTVDIFATTSHRLS